MFINKEADLAKFKALCSGKNLMQEYQIRKLNILDINSDLKSQPI